MELPGTHAKELANRYGLNNLFPPTWVYIVTNENKVKEIQIVRVRSCDNGSDVSWADPIGFNGSVSTFYLFSHYSKPQLIEMKDDFGTFHQWAVIDN